MLNKETPKESGKYLVLLNGYKYAYLNLVYVSDGSVKFYERYPQGIRVYVEKEIEYWMERIGDCDE